MTRAAHARSRHHPALRGCAVALAAWLFAAAQAGTPAFQGADLKLGERLIHDGKCSECHVRSVGGDGSAIYRPKGRIATPSALRTQVEYCSTQLNLQFFPEDVDAVAAVLNRDHYHFP